jgi:hypothetical protein
MYSSIHLLYSSIQSRSYSIPPREMNVQNNRFLLLTILLIQGLLWGSRAQQYQPISTACSAAIGTFSVAFEAGIPDPCGTTLVKVLTTSSSLNICLKAGDGYTDCTNPYNYRYNVILPPYYVPTASSTCPLCGYHVSTSSTVCQSLLVAVSELAGGAATSSITDIPGSADVASQCSNFLDFLTISGARYQSQILCSSNNTYGYPESPVNTLIGALDMRSLFQCGVCSMMPCLPGQYCGQNVKAAMCPAGYYCPSPDVIYECPTDHYCPLASLSPIRCRSLAAGSCSGTGAKREVVWVPMLACFLALLLLALAYRFPPSKLQVVLGHTQGSNKVVSNVDRHFISSTAGNPLESLDFSEADSLLSPNPSPLPSMAQSDHVGVWIEFSDLVMISGD